MIKFDLLFSFFIYLNKIGDNSEEVYEINMDKLNPYISKLKYKNDTYYYSLNSNMAINYDGKIDGKENIHHVLNASGKSEENENLPQHVEKMPVKNVNDYEWQPVNYETTKDIPVVEKSPMELFTGNSAILDENDNTYASGVGNKVELKEDLEGQTIEVSVWKRNSNHLD